MTDIIEGHQHEKNYNTGWIKLLKKITSSFGRFRKTKKNMTLRKKRIEN